MNECHDGEIDYIPGENYIKSNCTQQCTCSEDRFKGHLDVNAANGDVSMVCTKISFPFL